VGRASAAALVADLRGRLDATLRDLVAPGSRVALVDFPDHRNVGDSAIWLGTVAALDRLDARTVYVCTQRRYSPEHLRRQRPDVVLLAGGGNLGDRYRDTQAVRERVLRDAADAQVVQLPQSIEFVERDAIARARAAFDGHGAFTLLVRDEASLAFARSEFEATSVLCPDLAFALGPLTRPGPPTTPVLWLSRDDDESVTAPMRGEPDVEVVDWMARQRRLDATAAARATWLLHRVTATWPGVEPGWRSLDRSYRAVARAHLRRGTAVLGRGRAVVTDRLHGHILAVLLGIPHVVLDNSSGKVRSFFQTWTREVGLAAWADSAPEALERARRAATDMETEP
jgi:pyruvyl transferase EpsO